MTITHSTDITAAGKRLVAVSHFAVVNGRLTCVGLDLRSPAGEWTEITSPVLRDVRSSEIIRDASEAIGASVPIPPPPIPGAPGDGKKRPGRKPTMTDAVLRDVVAVPYLRAARNTAAAVQRALDDAGIYEGGATVDHARKAIARARRRGILPPVRGGA